MASTAVAPLPGAQAAPSPARHVRPWAGGGLVAVMVLVVVLQRFVVPPGTPEVALSLPLVYVGVGVLMAAGRLRVDRVRLELFAIAAVLVLAATAVAGSFGGSVSVTSIGLLLFLWAPWVLRLPPGHLHVQRRVGCAFVDLMVVLALVGVAMFAVQFAGLWTYQDYPSAWFPDLLVDGYNTSDPIFFGSPVWKSNAFVFLEPSFFSQYCALGALVALVLRQPAWKLLVLVLGIGTAVSGTGIILLAVGLGLVVLRAPRLLRPSTFVAAGAAAAAVLLSPVFPLLVERVDEPSQVGSSGYLRFVQPYTEVFTGLEESPLRYLVGAGAGAVQRLLESGEGGTQGQAVLYSIIPKAVFEYGVVAGGVFILFIVLAVLDRAPWPVVPGAVVVMLLFLNGNLLQPQTVATAWLLTSLFTDQLTGPGTGLAARARSRLRERARTASGGPSEQSDGAVADGTVLHSR